MSSSWLIVSNALHKMVRNILDDVVRRPRNLDYQQKEKPLPNEILWIQTYGPGTVPIKNWSKM